MYDETILRDSVKKKQRMNGTVVCTLVILTTLMLVFGWPRFVTKGVYGLFGVYSYAMLFLCFWAGIGLRFRNYQISARYITLGGIMIFALFTSVHLAFTYKEIAPATATFAKYLEYGFKNLTPGGALFAVPTFALSAVFMVEGTFVVLAATFIVCAAFITAQIVTNAEENNVIQRAESSFEIEAPKKAKKDVHSSDHTEKTKKMHAILDAKYQEILQKQSRKRLDTAKSELGITAPAASVPQSAIYDEPVPLSEIESSSAGVAEEITQWSTDAAQKFNEGLGQQGVGLADFLPKQGTISAQTFSPYSAFGAQQSFQQNGQSGIAQSAPQFGSGINQGFGPMGQMNTQPPENSHGLPGFVGAPQSNSFSPDGSFSQFGAPSSGGNISHGLRGFGGEDTDVGNTFNSDTIADARLNRRLERARARGGSLDDRINARAGVEDSRDGGLDDRINARGAQQIRMEVEPRKPKIYRPKKYIKPSVDMIRTESTNLSEYHIEAEERKSMLNDKFKEFRVGAQVGSYTVAPAVTRFEVQLNPGTRVAQVEQLEDDLAYVLGSQKMRIETTIEGKNAIGIEVPNKSVGKVSIKDILATREFQMHKSPLAVAVGKNINDEVVIGDISTMPHLLIAGSTGSGKSVCLNTLLTSLLFRAHPDEVKLLLVDMKRVELNMYNEIPHMLIPRAINEVQQVINALKWMQTEMIRRYKILEDQGVTNIGLYHSLPAYASGILERMPYIIMVIDEAADLIARGKKDVEESIKSLSSLARACGIHIILATQRPSADVITSVIKTNFVVRIAFKVSSRGDSITIINNSGAEKLVGRGDMLFSKEGSIQRVQGAFIEHDEARKIMNFIRDNNPAEFDSEIEDIILNGPPAEGGASGFGDAEGIRGARAQDSMFSSVLKWLVRDDNYTKTASISGLQRQFGIGFARAGKIIDQLAAAGYVGQANGTKTRSVLVTKEEVESVYGME